VHRRLLRSYKGAVRADILTVGVFLIYVHHGGTYIVPPGHFQFLERPLCLGRKIEPPTKSNDLSSVQINARQ
jgi:hypothetical protein